MAHTFFSLPRLTAYQRDVLNIIYNNGGYIAGGYAVYLKGLTTEFDDIDTFFPTERDYLNCISALVNFGTPMRQTEYGACCYADVGDKRELRHPISLNAVVFANHKNIFKTFDFSLVCEAVVLNTNRELEHYTPQNVLRVNTNPTYTDNQKLKIWYRLEKYLKRTAPTSKGRVEIIAAMREFLYHYGVDVVVTHSPKHALLTQYNNLPSGVLKKTKSIIAMGPQTNAKPGPANSAQASAVQINQAFVQKMRKSIEQQKHFKEVADCKEPQHSECPHRNVKDYFGLGLFPQFKYCEDCGKRLT